MSARLISCGVPFKDALLNDLHHIGGDEGPEQNGGEEDIIRPNVEQLAAVRQTYFDIKCFFRIFILTTRLLCDIITMLSNMVGVAQLVRAPGCGPGGRGFDSHRSPHEKALAYASAFSVISARRRVMLLRSDIRLHRVGFAGQVSHTLSQLFAS